MRSPTCRALYEGAPSCFLGRHPPGSLTTETARLIFTAVPAFHRGGCCWRGCLQVLLTVVHAKCPFGYLNVLVVAELWVWFIFSGQKSLIRNVTCEGQPVAAVSCSQRRVPRQCSTWVKPGPRLCTERSYSALHLRALCLTWLPHAAPIPHSLPNSRI